jgi:hypothetical protein
MYNRRKGIKQLCIILFVGIIIVSSCDVFFQIRIKNETSKPISVVIRLDTIHDEEINAIDYCLSTIIAPGKELLKSARGGYKGLDNYKLFFVAYDVDTLLKYRNTIYIDTNRLYIRKFTYSYDELEKMKWLVKIK